jgi:hypothetical protein
MHFVDARRCATAQWRDKSVSRARCSLEVGNSALPASRFADKQSGILKGSAAVPKDRTLADVASEIFTKVIEWVIVAS